MRDLQKTEATVFVYRHKTTGIVKAHYIEAALNFEETAEWEHVATLNPRAWIEFNYSVAEQRDDLLAALKALEDACDKRVSCLSREAYLVAERCKGMKDALNALDDARHLARATISKVESEK